MSAFIHSALTSRKHRKIRKMEKRINKSDKGGSLVDCVCLLIIKKSPHILTEGNPFHLLLKAMSKCWLSLLAYGKLRAF